MNRKTKTILICSAILMLIGGAMMAIGLLNGAKTTLYWDSQKHRLVSADEDELYITQEKMSVDQFETIDIDVSRAQVNLVPSDGYYVEYAVMSESKNPLTLQNGRLTFRDDTGRFFEINLDFRKHDKKEYLTIYYPKDADFDTIEANLDMGSLDMDGVNAKVVDIELSMGSLSVENSNMDTFSAELDMGNLTMEKTETGTFSAELSMGDLRVSESVVTAEMDAELDMGSADISLAKIDGKSRKIQYGCDIETDMGDIKIDGIEQGNKFSQMGDVMLKISCDMGGIELNLY